MCQVIFFLKVMIIIGGSLAAVVFNLIPSGTFLDLVLKFADKLRE